MDWLNPCFKKLNKCLTILRSVLDSWKIQSTKILEHCWNEIVKIIVCFGLSAPSKTPPSYFLFLTNPPPPPTFNLKNAQAPHFLGDSPLYIGFFMNPPPHFPLLKIRFFSEPQKYSSFSSLTPSNLLKITKFLVKVSQFEFFVMTEKNSFVSKLFLSLNISDIVYLLCKNCAPPSRKGHPPLSHQPPSKNYSPVRAPLF